MSGTGHANVPAAASPVPAFPADAPNDLILRAEIAERSALRYTPGGLPALNVVLAHASERTSPGLPARQVQVQVKAVAFGELARTLDALPLGQVQTFSGFLNGRRGGRTVVFHLTGWTT